MTTKFGIEIEFLGMSDDLSSIKTRLARKNVKVQTSGDTFYNPLKDHWKITHDGSVYNEENILESEDYCEECESYSCNCGYYEPNYEQGAELVSPVLKYNQESFEEVKNTLAALRHFHSYTNDTCGLHVHVDANFLLRWSEQKQEKFFQFLIDEYAEIEPELDAKMNPSRRDDENEFCASMVGARLSRVRGSRYFKLNILAFIKHGTIEFRHHHGSLDDNEVIEWIKFCVTFMKNARKKFRLKLAEEETRVERVIAASTTLTALHNLT